MQPSRRLSLLAAAALLAAGASSSSASSPAGSAAGTAAHRSLPPVGTGPDALHAPAPRAPQLESTGVWRAEPLLVSGATAYRDGEWLYQDHLHDDRGATGVADPGSIWGPGDHLYSPGGGTLTYPTDEVYAHNAADLVELRVKPVPGATAFRVTLNTLLDPSRSAFTIALGDGGSDVAWPFGAGVSGPATHFVTWHGTTAFLTTPGGTRAEGLPVTVDLLRRQIEVRVPTALFDPGSGVVRTTVGTGLWDVAADRYLAPQPGAASATTPGGGRPGGAALFNVGPRPDEPLPAVKGKGLTMADTAAAGVVEAPWWRERQQSQVLATGSVKPFAASVDFGKLRSRVTDESGLPRTGSLNRIFASRHSSGQGVDLDGLCFDLGRVDKGSQCIGRLVGQLQAYTVYVPERPAPAEGFPLTLLLHSLSANHNQYAGSQNQRQLGERGPGSIVITPAGRGPDGFYKGLAETDVFEVWSDVARTYRLDPARVTSTGYSMGGFGTYRLLARYPDLFARGWSVVGAPGSVDDQLASLHNTPLLAWNATADELVNLQTAENAHRAVVAAGLRTEYLQFPTADHLTLASNDEWAPGAAFLEQDRVDRDPARVRYVLDPREDLPGGGVVADSAYWVSGLQLREGATTGSVDARSLAGGLGDAPVLPVATTGGVLAGGALPAAPFLSRAQAWGPALAQPARNALAVDVQRLSRVVVDPRRAGLSCQTAVEVRTDGPVEVVLTGCGRTVRAG